MTEPSLSPKKDPKLDEKKEEHASKISLKPASTIMSDNMNHEKKEEHGGCYSPVTGGFRKKAPPVCRVPALRKENMIGKELSKWSFSLSELFPEGHSGSFNEMSLDPLLAEPSHVHKEHDDPITISPGDWVSFKGTILKRTESRNGRELQRFATDQRTGQVFRLTTGAVPIMKDGKILLVSSNSKAEWILPKGGWESDESLEVSAIREVYEEGGVLGALGPQLNDVFYETRKAKKRRIELEMINKKAETPFGCVSVQSTNSSATQSEDDNSGTSHSLNEPQISMPARKECLATRIRNQMEEIKVERNDETASIASAASDLSSTFTHICMKMFPLYVLEVRDHWPENGRARKVVDIDKAIEIMSLRPEFQKVLIELKEKGLHHYSPGKIQSRVQSQRSGDTSLSSVKKI